MPGRLTRRSKWKGPPEGTVRLAYLVRSWPRLSQTFIANELLALERLGLDVEVFAMARSGERLRQPQALETRAPVVYLEDQGRVSWMENVREHLVVGSAAPMRYLSTLVYLTWHRNLTAGYTTASTARCFRHAVHLALLLSRRSRAGRQAGHLHAHFAHDPALIAALTHRLTGVPFSLTAHARDLYQIRPAAFVARARGARAVITCCAVNAAYVRRLLASGPERGHRADPGPEQRMVHHGVDLEVFHPRRTTADGGPPVLVSVGRLVEKKGFPDLLRAYAAVKATGQDFRCVVYGDGPLRDELLALRDRLGLGDEVTFAGERSQPEIVRAMQGADVFALTPFVADDGDRDGVPNVLVEAMACGCPIVATAAGGVAELITPEVNGLVAPPRDVAAIAAHLGRLLADAQLRRRLGAAARQTVRDRYDVRAAARELAGIFAHRFEAAP